MFNCYNMQSCSTQILYYEYINIRPAFKISFKLFTAKSKFERIFLIACHIIIYYIISKIVSLWLPISAPQ